MRRSVLLIIPSFALAIACGGADRATGVTANKQDSFSLYDISSNSPYSAGVDALTSRPGDSNRPANQTPANSTSIAGERLNKLTSSHDQNPLPDIDRKVVRNAELDLEADSPDETQQAITAIVEKFGGFVVESQSSTSDIQSSTRDTATLTSRVPTDKFSEALEEIRKTGTLLISETVKGQDVTEEFIDIEARLKAKKALEAQVMDIMRRANTIDEAIDVQGRLADVRADIEKIEGRKRFLENQSSLSTIKVRMQTAKVFAASSRGFGGRLADSFDAGFQVAMNFVLGLITAVVALFPFALLIGLPTVLVFRYLWKKQARPKSVSEIARDEIT
jgi:hypothetical protein